ncbi:hypothetical protein [Bradyrhizobium diversitatis]|uniref:hypothetical protein n=1 Tax=Bradyrhizobium diversitatis TaxID=2755406 RepID=UPI001AED80D5|nr:hypothetical protein [Bradyrhizobium diversitatis]
MSNFLRGLGLASLVCVASCTNIPQLREDGVAISDIVERIKCEMAFALPPIGGAYPTGDFQWLRYWTAKVDLTLVTNEQSSLNPSILVTEPTYSVAAGGGVSGTAIRNEVLSFTLSVDELMRAQTLDCAGPLQEGLLGHLGLEEWIQSALAPAGNGQLTIGYHAPPTGKPAPLPGPTGQQPAEAGVKEIELANRALLNSEELAQKARIYAARAKALALQKNIQGTYDAASKANGAAVTALEQADKGQAWVWRANIAIRGGQTPLPEQDTLFKKIPDALKAATEEANGAVKAAKAAWELLPRDPPIDSISHQAQFIVAVNGNVTPSWSLVRFKGPGTNGTFLSGSRTTTNTLNIVLGQPSDDGPKSMSDEQKRQLFYQRLEQLRLVVVPTTPP